MAVVEGIELDDVVVVIFVGAVLLIADVVEEIIVLF